MLSVFDEWFARSFCVGRCTEAESAGTFQATVNNVPVSSGRCDGIFVFGKFRGKTNVSRIELLFM